MEAADRRGLSSVEKGLLVLLVASIFINYIDRSNLSIAATLLEKELSLTPSQLGSLLAAFSWTYALFQLFGVAGWFADRYPVGWVFAAGFFIWTTATAATGMVTGFTALFIMRLLLGAGESIAYPCYSKILAGDFPDHHRGFANALIDAGSKLGPALGTYIGGFLVARVGWRVFFIGLGLMSLLWLIPWIRYMPRRHPATQAHDEYMPSVGAILSQRSAWGAFVGHFCGNYFWYFLLTWIPSYLIRNLGFSLERMAEVGGLLYLAIACATIVAGWVSDRWIASGASPTLVRKTIVVSGLMGSTLLIIPVAFLHDLNLTLLFLFLASMSFGVYASNHWATTQTLSGAMAAGRWTSIQNGVGNLAGVAAPWITGMVVERTGTFSLAFLVASAVAFTGAVMWGIVVGPVAEVRWRVKPGNPAAA